MSGDEEEGADGEGEIVPPKSGLHCRVTADGGGAEKKTQFLKAYHQALKAELYTIINPLLDRWKRGKIKKEVGIIFTLIGLLK